MPKVDDANSTVLYVFIHLLTDFVFSESIVTVTAQDFAKLSFAEQVRLSHSASVFLSMHGAGTTHIFHMAVGQVYLLRCNNIPTYIHFYVHNVHMRTMQKYMLDSIIHSHTHTYMHTYAYIYAFLFAPYIHFYEVG